MTDHRVIVYTTSSCPWCRRAKAFLAQHGIPFEERNLSMEPAYEEDLLLMGSMGVPTLVVDGEVIVGFDQDRLTELLLTP